MTQELTLIEEIFNLYNKRLQPNTIIYKDKRMRQRRDKLVLSSYLLMFLLLLPLFLLLKYPNYPIGIIIYILVYALIPVCIYYFVINPKDKAQLKAMGIPASKCFWKSWYNNVGYHKYKIDLFTDLLKKRLKVDIISLSDEKLRVLLDLLYKRAEDNRPISPYKVKIFQFLAPILSILVTLLLQSHLPKELTFEHPKEAATYNLTFLAAVIIIALAFWTFISLVIWEIERKNNSKSRIYKEIANIIEEIRFYKIYTKE